MLINHTDHTNESSRINVKKIFKISNFVDKYVNVINTEKDAARPFF